MQLSLMHRHEDEGNQEKKNVVVFYCDVARYFLFNGFSANENSMKKCYSEVFTIQYKKNTIPTSF